MSNIKEEAERYAERFYSSDDAISHFVKGYGTAMIKASQRLEECETANRDLQEDIGMLKSLLNKCEAWIKTACHPLADAYLEEPKELINEITKLKDQ